MLVSSETENIYSLSIKRSRTVVGVIGDAFSSDSLVQYIQCSFLIAGIMVKIGFRWWWRIWCVLLDVEFAVNAGQVYKLGREPHKPQQ